MSARRPPQAVYFPAVTWDYYLRNDEETGIGLVARRKIRKGKMIFSDSIEFHFTDVIEGDYLLFRGHREASRLSGTKVPSMMPLTREMLLRTHGVPFVSEDGETMSWRLEVPGMLMNHSCDPTVADDVHDALMGEGFATRTLRKGEELTYNYVLQFFDRGPFFEKCLCGTSSCLGKMEGFKELASADKEKYFSKASEAVQAMHRADIGEGSLPTEEPIVVRHDSPSRPDAKRLVFPGPSYAHAGVAIKRGEGGEFSLRATKDYSFGERVYEFWRDDWPFAEGGVCPRVDVVASQKLSRGDLSEGEVIRVAPAECAARRDRGGRYKFSGWDLLVAHSCEPNLTYCDLHEDEDDEWQGAYAVRAIKEGEMLTVDFNSVLWDRSDGPDVDGCRCGAAKCAGTMKGFKYLPEEAQVERKLMSWRRVAPPYDGEEDVKYLGRAMTPHVRERVRLEDERFGSVGCDITSGSDTDDSSSDED